MSLDRTQLLGMVRGTSRPNYPETDAVPGLTNGGETLVALGLSPKAENVRRGNTWSLCIALANAFTHVAAWPTTRAELVLWNGEPSNGKSLIIERIWGVNIATSIAAAAAYTLLGQIVGGAAAPTDNTSQLITSLSGKNGTYGGRAKKAIANTSYALADRWSVLAANPAGPAASIGLGVIANVDGGLIVPPGAILCLNLITGTATGTSSIGVEWTEEILNLG